MLSKNINIPALMKSNDQASVINDMEESKEEPILIGRTPELSYSLHFTFTPSLHHPDAGFDMLGISRDTLITAFLNELTNCQNKKIDSEAINAISQFKCGFIDEIKTALEKKLITDEKGLELYQQEQNYIATLHTIQQRWQYEREFGLIEYLYRKRKDLAYKSVRTFIIGQKNSNVTAVPLPQSSDEANKLLQLQQLKDDISSLESLPKKHPTVSLDEYCNELFLPYIELLKKDLPLHVNSIFRYASLKELSIYLWQQNEQSYQHLILKRRILNKSSRQAPIHILFQDGQLIKLNNHCADFPLSPAENIVIENEMEQARKIINLSSENKLLTVESALLENTNLPQDLVRMIVDLSTNKNFSECVEENIINFDSNTFWEDVVGRYPLKSLYPFNDELIGEPDVRLLAKKLSNVTESLKLFEPWAHLILLYYVEELKVSFEIEQAGDDYVGILLPNNFFKTEDTNNITTELVQLKQLLTSLSLDLLFMLLQDQNVLSIIQRYPRLQAVFLERILKERPPFSEHVNAVISSWLAGINDFVFYRMINSLLLSSVTSLAKIKTIPAINNKLIQHELDNIEEVHSFVNAICQNTFRFIKEFNQVNAEEHFTHVIIKPKSHLSEVTQEFRQYCRAEDKIADWYIIYQYLISGVSVPNEVIGKLISQSNRQAVKAILQIPDIDVNDNSGDMTFLMQAAQNGDTEIVAELLARPEININKTCHSQPEHKYYNYTALTFSVEHHHEDVVALLLATPGIELKFKVSDYKRIKDYRIIKLLFQAEELGKLTDQQFLKYVTLQNILSTAAAISHDVVRCANLVINMRGIVHRPDIIEFLLHIPGVDANKVLIKLASATYSEKHEILFSEIISRPEITAESINKAQLELIDGFVYCSEDEKKHQLAIAKILLSHPAINVNQAGLLAGALRYPAITRLLFTHPNFDKQSIKHLLAEKINKRINLVANEVTTALTPSKIIPNYYSSSFGFYQNDTTQHITLKPEEIVSIATYSALELTSIIESIEDAIIRSSETTMKLNLPENITLDRAHTLFWPIKYKQIELLKEISLLAEASCLLVEEIIPFIEIAVGISLIDVIDVLLSTSQMQAVVYHYIENQSQGSADKQTSSYRFFSKNKTIHLPEFTLIAKCISLLAEHTDKSFDETILSYVNGKSANDNKVWPALGAMQFSTTRELNERAVVDEMPDERYQTSPR